MNVIEVIRWIILGYIAGAMLMLVGYCVGWVWGATLSFVESWAKREPLTADDLSMDIREMGPPLWVMPAISPLIIGLFALIFTCGTVYVFAMVIQHRVAPLFKRITLGNFNLPSWFSLDRLAASLNKLTGTHNESK